MISLMSKIIDAPEKDALRTTIMPQKSSPYVRQKILYSIETLDKIATTSLTNSSKSMYLGEIVTAIEFLLTQMTRHKVCDRDLITVAEEHQERISPMLYEFLTEVFSDNTMTVYELFFERQRAALHKNNKLKKGDPAHRYDL